MSTFLIIKPDFEKNHESEKGLDTIRQHAAGSASSFGRENCLRSLRKISTGFIRQQEVKMSLNCTAVFTEIIARNAASSSM